MIPVIICGGVGTKMWPASRKSHPKHFLPLLEGRSLFQENWRVLRQQFSPSEIFLQTNAFQAEIAKQQVPEVVEQNIFLEPDTLNTGPASGLAAMNLYKIDQDEPFMLIQADVLRKPSEKFFSFLSICDEQARLTDKYITGVYAPKFAVMGVDYLLPGKQVLASGGVEVFEVDQFLWRADKSIVQEYLDKGALLHANHTCMTPRNFLAMYKKYKPEWYAPLQRILEGSDLHTEYASMPSGPIEEVTEQVHRNNESLIVTLPFEWTDFGTWESYAVFLDQNKLPQPGVVEQMEGQGNFAFTKPAKTTVFLGVENLVVVDTEDALLVCKKNTTGKVGEVVKKLEEKGASELL